MKLALLSDLHMEVSSFRPKRGRADVVIVAGDLMAGPEPEEGLWLLRRALPEETIVYVPGNHEFDAAREDVVLKRLKGTAIDLNITMLVNQTCDLHGLRIIGTPLWSGFDLFGPAKRAAVCKLVGMGVSDFHHQRLADGRLLTPEIMRLKHLEALAFIEAEIDQAWRQEIPFMVVTHWAPARGSIAKMYQGQLENAYWVNACERLVAQVPLWHHGHCHHSFRYRVGGSHGLGEVACNPRGYSRLAQLSSNPDFSNPLVVEAPRFLPKRPDEHALMLAEVKTAKSLRLG